jgi:hypothetical protein
MRRTREAREDGLEKEEKKKKKERVRKRREAFTHNCSS